ncbi:glucokinase [Sphingomonas sp. FW199]|uniref:glucokinase n=1 Tax=Sphingomonas sp. FW199 TaxID=3400217 RepID=UPI003CED2AF9
MDVSGGEPRLAVSVGETQIRLAWINAAGRPEQEQSWAMADLPTLTDALMRYERETGRPLTGASAAIAIIGATHGDTIAIARGRWMITRSGLQSIFRSDPQIINDVAVHAWAAIGGHGVRFEALSRNSGDPVMTQQGRWLVTHIDFGVGLAVIDVDRTGTVRMLETEMGHCGFPPESDEDDALARSLRARSRRSATWENVLALSHDDAAWSVPGLPAGRAERLTILARAMGRFARDAVLAHGAWSGILLMGRRVGEMTGAGLAECFNAGFDATPKFQRLINLTPRWRLSGHDLAMEGLAYSLIHRVPIGEHMGDARPPGLPAATLDNPPAAAPPAAAPPSPAAGYMPMR